MTTDGEATPGAGEPEATGPALPTTPEGETHVLTPAESAGIAQGLYRPTVKRLTVLIQTLVDMTQAGDFAVWAPIAAMEQVVLDLRWDRAQPRNLEKFCALAAKALHAQAERFSEHGDALAALEPGQSMPKFREWETADTLRIYDELEKLYPPEAPRG